MKLTVLMPCLDEAKTLPACVARAKTLLAAFGNDGEIVVADNGSTDGSQALAESLGARVVNVAERGYGAALSAGIEAARGDIVVMGDADDSYHFEEAVPLVRLVENGAALAMGNRFGGRIMQGAMPFMNRYLGNPVLSLLGRVLFRIPVRDFHCGMRAFRRDKIAALPLVTTGMEWASEQVIKAKLAGLVIREAPVNLHKDGRDRAPHLKPFSDGWRHLRFMLLHAPSWLFTVPGGILSVVGLMGVAVLSRGAFSVGAVTFDVHTLLVSGFLVVAGMQILYFGAFARTYARNVGLLPGGRRQAVSLERFLLAGLALIVAGVGFIALSLYEWYGVGFQGLDLRMTLRQVIPGVTMAIVGLQTSFAAFLFGALDLKVKK